MELSEWSWGFSFGSRSIGMNPANFSTTKLFQLKGRVLTEVGVKYPTASVAFIPGQVRTGSSPREEAHGGKLRGIFTLAEDSMATLLSVLAADKFRYLSARGGRLRDSIARHMGV